MTVVVIGDNTGDDYSGTEDANIRNDNPTTNYGSATAGEVTKYDASTHRHWCLKFSGLSNVTGPVTANSATVDLYLVSGGGGTPTHGLRMILVNWVEAEVTYNIHSTGNNWTTAGGLSDGNDRSATVSGSAASINTTAGYKTHSGSGLGTDCAGFVNGTYNNYGWHVERTDGANDSVWRQFRHSEGTDGQRPYLTFDYTEGSGSKPKTLLLMGCG